MTNRRLVLSLPVVALIAACTPAGDFYQQPFEATSTSSRSYQAVYASTLQTIRSCVLTGPAGFGFAGPQLDGVDAQLYTELGYGEIEFFTEGFGRFPHWQVRIAAASGGGSLISYRTGSGTDRVRQRYIAMLQHWVGGGTDCNP